MKKTTVVFAVMVIVLGFLFGCGPSPKPDPYRLERQAFLFQLEVLEKEIVSDPRWSKIFFDVDLCPEWDVNGRPDGIRLVILGVYGSYPQNKKNLQKFANKFHTLAKKMLKEKGIDVKTVRGFLILFEDVNGFQHKVPLSDYRQKNRQKKV